MSSSLRGKSDPQHRLASDEDAVAYSDNARPTDDSPTVISKTPPIVEPAPSNLDNKIVDLNRKPTTPESIVAGLRGRRLAHFELIEPIGHGGMAAVIRARDMQLDRFVALKILPPDMARDHDNIERFRQEAKAAAKLDHEKIARVFYCGEEQGLFFIAFEFVEGINLRILMERRGLIPVPEAVRYILQIAAGLEHAGTRGVVHRDVKPSNIIITPTGRAKLVDMGLARNMERHGERDLTQSGVTLGTFDYISPEQALEPRDADSRSDIYSLGCTFYHMLTGLPPVPEGTPAKKLQHHQHHMPIDPRQIDPSIPVEIVLILQKMMAKNPRDRYQRPIHLVHRLVQVAQQIGVADDAPEGMLLLDAPLPSRPLSRPFLILGMALAALAAITLILSLAPDRRPPIPPTGPGGPKESDVKSGQAKSDGGDKGQKPVGIPDVPPRVVTNLADLKQVLAGPGTRDKVLVALKNVIDIDGLIFKGSKDQRLELESEEADNNILRFNNREGASAAGLIIESGDEVIFRKIKFQIESQLTPDQAIAAVTIRGARTVTFDQCIFPQQVPKISTTGKRVPLASILIEMPEGGNADRPVVVNIKSCCFEPSGPIGGQVAIAVNGPATINVTHTGFKPHSALFSFRDKCTEKGTILNLQHCTGFVVQGPAFRFTAEASAQIRAQNSVFSRPDRRLSDSGPAMPGLIYLSAGKSIRYEGSHNLYHALNDFVEKRNGEFITKIDDFKKFLAQSGGFDHESEIIDLADPTSPLQQESPLTSTNLPELAFQLKDGYHGKFGMQQTWLGPMPAPPSLGPQVKKTPATPKLRKIVDAEDGGVTPGVFSNVAAALSGAQDGDVIYIKHGEKPHVLVPPPVVIKPGIFVTLKPFEGFQPILVLDPAFEENDTALFKVQKSKLQVEQMEILLDPKPGFDARSVVQMGEAHCVFKNCIFTLRAPDRVDLSVVSFLEFDRMMKMDGPAPGPSKVEFHECFVRGKGDLVSLRGCRLLNVEMKNSLVALDGSLLDVQANTKPMSMTQGVRWKMERSSVFTTDSIFALRSKSGQFLTETHADFDGCLLAALPGPDQPIVLLDMEKNDDLDKYLKWTGKKVYYANFANHRDWKGQFPDMTSDYGKLAFSLKLSDETKQTLWDATPDWFKPMDAEQERMIQGFGLPPEMEKRLMQPTLDPDEP